MPEIPKLHFEDAFDDAPQTRSLLGVFEQDASMLRSYAVVLHRCCHRILNAQSELSAATQCLSAHIQGYEKQKFPLETEDSILGSTLRQFAQTIDEISSWQEVLATQLSDGMMFPLTRFLDNDMSEIQKLSNQFQYSGQEHEKALERYTRLSKKKENKKQVMEANEDVFVFRKKYHQTALQYYRALNLLQYKRRCSLLEPLLGYLHAIRAFFKMGHESISVSDLDEFLSNISASVQSVHSEMNQEHLKSSEVVNAIEVQSAHKYYLEPHLTHDLPFIPPNTNLVQKGGYLFHRTGGLLHRWDREYFFTVAGNLMHQPKGEEAGRLMIELDGTATVREADLDDRRWVFVVGSVDGSKTFHLQAENSRDKDEWVATLRNIIKENSSGKEKLKARAKEKEKEKHSSESSKDHSPTSSGAVSGGPSPQHASPIRDILMNTPIQFDMISPSDDSKEFLPEPKDGPPRRINPFDQPASDVISEEHQASPQPKTFHVKFCGSMKVPFEKGEKNVHQTISHILQARTQHNVVRMCNLQLTVSPQQLRLVDAASRVARMEFSMADVCFWASHKDDPRLFGFVSVTSDVSQKQREFACHVFEAEGAAADVCSALSAANKEAFKLLIEAQNEKKREMDRVKATLSGRRESDGKPRPPRPPPPLRTRSQSMEGGPITPPIRGRSQSVEVQPTVERRDDDDAPLSLC